jgi:hypothetical protein
MRKPEHLCSHDGCINRAKWTVELVLLQTPLRGATTIAVCSAHRKAAEEFLLNDGNRTRLANRLVLEGFCDPFTAYGVVKHNTAIEFGRIAQPAM